MEPLLRFVAKYSGILLLAYIGSAGWPLFSITIEKSVPFWWAIKWVGLPMLPLLIYCGWKYREIFGYSNSRYISYWATLGALCFTVLIMSYGHAVALNALLSSSEKIPVTGEIVSMQSARGKGARTYSITIKTDSRTVIWPVAETTYNKFKVSDTIRFDARRGAFGFLFRWRSD